MITMLWALTGVGLAGFIAGLYCQYRSRNRFNIRRNQWWARITAASLVLMLAGAILLKVIG